MFGRSGFDFVSFLDEAGMWNRLDEEEVDRRRGVGGWTREGFGCLVLVREKLEVRRNLEVVEFGRGVALVSASEALPDVLGVAIPGNLSQETLPYPKRSGLRGGRVGGDASAYETCFWGGSGVGRREGEPGGVGIGESDKREWCF